MSYIKKNILEGRKVEHRNEIIFEFGADENIGIALAKIKESEPHYHKETTELYLIVDGSAKIYLNEKEEELKKFDVLKIEPGVIHYVRGNVKLWVISYPPWKKEDYYKVIK